jgi:hypothetical protein
MISLKEIWAFAAQKHDFPSKNLVIQLYGLATAGLLAWLEEKPTWAVGWLGLRQIITVTRIEQVSCCHSSII